MSQFCSKCGTKNLDEAMFCKNCGFNMQEAAAKDENKHTSGSQSEMDHFFNGSQSENSDDSQRVKEIDRELKDYENRKNDEYIDNRIKELNVDPWPGFFMTIAIFAISVILGRGCS